MRNWLLGIVNRLRTLLPRTTYFNRLIWFGCLSVSIPIVLAGSTYYHVSMVKLTDQYKEDNKASLLLLKDRMENAFFNIESDSLKIANNPTIKDNLGKAGFSSDIFLQILILDTLQLHKNSNSFINEIVFYDKQSGFVLSNNYGYMAYEQFFEREDVEAAMRQKEQARWTYLPQSGKNGLVAFVRLINGNDPQGAVIIYVKESQLRSMLMNHAAYSKHQSFIVVDSYGSIILHSTDNHWLGRPAEQMPGLTQIMADEMNSGMHVMHGEEDDTPLLAGFSKTTVGRTYISLIPEDEMLQQLSWIRAMIVFSVILFLGMGIVLNWLASRRAYNPIEKLLQYGEQLQHGQQAASKENEIEYIKSCLQYLSEQSVSLENYLKQIQPNLRDRLLQKLLKGGAGSRSSLLEECGQFDIPQQGNYFVLVTIVENMFKEKRFLPSEGAIVTFAVTNVINELLVKSGLTGYVVEQGEKEGVAVLHFQEETDKDQMLRMVKTFAEEIRRALAVYLSFSVSVGIGGIAKDAVRLCESYRQAQRALQHRMFDETQSVLFYDELGQYGQQNLFSYPRELEKQIVEALSGGELALAEQALDTFAKHVKVSGSYNAIFQCYYVLLSSIIQSLEEKGPGMIDSLGDNWFDQLKARQTSREIYEWFIEIIFPLYQQITEESRKMGAKFAVQKVCKHIKEYPGADHSLIDCSELAGMSPSYFSRLFKREVGISFVEYVMEYKVDMAKRLLQDTDRSVMEIAEIVGYSERNLNRTFQRHVSMTPKQYRVSLR